MTECFELIDRKLLKGPWVMGERYTICDPRMAAGYAADEKAKLLSARRTQNHELQLAGHRMPDSHSCTRLLAPILNGVMRHGVHCHRHHTEQGCSEPEGSTAQSSPVEASSLGEGLMQ